MEDTSKEIADTMIERYYDIAFETFQTKGFDQFEAVLEEVGAQMKDVLIETVVDKFNSLGIPDSEWKVWYPKVMPEVIARFKSVTTEKGRSLKEITKRLYH